jgi:hypothetical protein
MLANAIADAKTNFFMQCSWEMRKWRSKKSLFRQQKGDRRGRRLSAVATILKIPRQPMLRTRIIESRHAADKQSAMMGAGSAARW